MPQDTPNENQEVLGSPLGPMVALIVIIVFLFLIVSARPPSSEPTQGQEVAMRHETETPQPSNTPVLPTSTAVPTETAELSPLPTDTAEPTEAATSSPVPSESPSPTATDTTASTNAPPAEEIDTPPTGAIVSAYSPQQIIVGEALFPQCAACHGQDGHGVPGLGKDLANSEFVHSQTDEDLLAFIKTGRPIWDEMNTTGVDMPPKGGNPSLTDEDILNIIAYIRSLAPTDDTNVSLTEDESTSDTEETTALIENSDTTAGDTTTETDDSATPVTDEEASETDDESPDNSEAESPVSEDAVYSSQQIIIGEALFPQCAACHGQDGHGVPGLGKDLANSEFVHSQTDEDLLTFIKTGRPIWDEMNTTGIDMPPKGGNPSLTDEDILNIIAYIRSLGDN